jgi:Ca2+/Na+ antiporter
MTRSYTQETGKPAWSYRHTTKADLEHQNSFPSSPKVSQILDQGVIVDSEGATEENTGSFNWRKWCRDPLTLFWEVTMPTAENHCAILFSLSIFFIAICSYFMVDATNRIGIILHIPPIVMGLVFLAAGTSIPDALGSIAVAKQGEGDMAIANALGSNVFDILLGLGIPWMIRDLMEPDAVEFKDMWNTFFSDIMILVFVLILFVGSLIVNRWHLSRNIGLLLLSFYVLYFIYIVLSVFVFKTKAMED